MKALLGRKVGMTQIFGEDGTVRQVTIVQAGPCVVTQLKNAESDGYQAVQIGFGAAKHPAKPQVGHAGNKDVTPAVMREIRMDKTPQDVEVVEGGELKVGDTLDVSLFEQGDTVQVTGTSKGKGFAGTVKRHNFATGPKTHGSHNYRAPGSIGAGYPQHVFKGMRMAGRMGGERTTVKNLKIVHVDVANNLLAISGAVPGPREGLVMVKGA